MPCFISVQLRKLPDGEQNADFTAPFTLLSSPCFQFCFAVGFCLLPGSQYHLFLILNLGLDQLTWFCPGVCPIRLPTRPSEPPIFTDAVTFCLQKKATLQYYARFPRGLVLQAPCTPPVFYHGDGIGEIHVYCGTGSMQPTVMLRRKQKRLCTGHTGMWHAVSIGCVKIHKAQEKSQMPSWTRVRTHN